MINDDMLFYPDTVAMDNTGTPAVLTAPKGKKKSTKGQGTTDPRQSSASGLQFAQNLYRCAKCNSNFPTEMLLAQHMELHLAIGGPLGGPNNADNASTSSAGTNGNGVQCNFYCLVCYRGFKTEYHLQAHSVVHAPR